MLLYIIVISLIYTNGIVSLNTLNTKLVGRYFMLSAPGAIVGAILLPYVKTSLLLIAFGLFVALSGSRMLFVKNAFRGSNEKTTLSIGFMGGMLKGMIATGLGKLLLPRLINKKGISHPEAVGTAVAIVFLANVIAVFSILSNADFHDTLINNWEQLFSIMVFVAPAVIIGGQIGPRIPKLISKELLVKYVGSLLEAISKPSPMGISGSSTIAFRVAGSENFNAACGGGIKYFED